MFVLAVTSKIDGCLPLRSYIGEMNKVYFNEQFRAITMVDLNKALWLKKNHKYSNMKEGIKNLTKSNEAGFYFSSFVSGS